MSKRVSKMLALAAAVAALFPAVLANAAPSLEPAVQPGVQEAVEPGSTISYEFCFAEGAAELTAVRIQLSAGVAVVQNSARFARAAVEGGQAGEALPPVADEGFDIVYGNDGLVLIASEVAAGDVLSFKATVGEGAQQVRCVAFCGEAEFTVEHSMALPEQATPTPAPQAGAEPAEPPQPQREGLPAWALVAIPVGAVALLGGAYLALLKAGRLPAALMPGKGQSGKGAGA